MATDMFGRTICIKNVCPAYGKYFDEEVCDALLMYHSKHFTLCKIPEKFILVVI